MVTFKRNNKMGVIGKRIIVVVNYVKTIQINIFPSIVEDNELSLADVNHGDHGDHGVAGHRGGGGEEGASFPFLELMN